MRSLYVYEQKLKCQNFFLFQLKDLNFPPIILVTASSVVPNDSDVQAALDIIELNRLPVYIFTFSPLKNSILYKLTTYGHLFTGENSHILEFSDTQKMFPELFSNLIFKMKS